jgi:hypothetical protein
MAGCTADSIGEVGCPSNPTLLLESSEKLIVAVGIGIFPAFFIALSSHYCIHIHKLVSEYWSAALLTISQVRNGKALYHFPTKKWIETDPLLGALRSEKCPGAGTPERAVSEGNSMTSYDPQVVESTDIPNSVDVLGVDGHGRTHFATSAVGGVTIYVGAEDGLEVFELKETPVDGLEGWIDHVGDLRGWNRLNYTDDWGDHVVATLTEGLEA